MVLKSELISSLIARALLVVLVTKRRWIVKPVEKARVLFRQGQELVNKADWQAAGEKFRESARLLIGTQTDPQLARALVQTAKNNSDAGQHDRPAQRKLLDEALDIFALHAIEDLDVAEALMLLGRTHQYAGYEEKSFAENERLWLKALQIRQQILGDHEMVAETHLRVAIMYASGRKHTDHLLHLRAAQDIQERLFGISGWPTLLTLQMIYLHYKKQQLLQDVDVVLNELRQRLPVNWQISAVSAWFAEKTREILRSNHKPLDENSIEMMAKKFELTLQEALIARAQPDNLPLIVGNRRHLGSTVSCPILREVLSVVQGDGKGMLWDYDYPQNCLGVISVDKATIYPGGGAAAIELSK